MRPISALLVLFATAACAPVITHGPRVRQGTNLGVNLGVPLRQCSSGDACGTGVSPEWTVGVRHGFMKDSAGAAVLVGASLPVFDGAPELDLYGQAPPRRWVGGAGVLASIRHLEPYVEAGPVGGWARGLYFTGGYAWLFSDPRFLQSGGVRMATPPRYWAPGAGYTATRFGRDATVYLSGAFGHLVERREVPAGSPGAFDTVFVRRSVRMVVVGLSAQASLGDLWRDLTRLPRPPIQHGP